MTDLTTIISHILSFSKTDLTSSEANTKKRIIEPLLEALGWNLLSNEVRLEHPVRIGTSTAYVDYVLTLEDKAVVLVEAKAFNEILSETYSSQIISYGRVEDVQWVVLTNGKTLKIFDTKAGRSEKECLVVEIDLEKLSEHVDEIRLLSRQSILTGEIEQTARRLAITRSAIQNLKQKQEELTDKFSKILIQMTSPDLEKRIQIISPQLVRQAIELLEEKAETPSSDRKPPSEIPSISKHEISIKPTGELIVCPSRVEGVNFLKKYNAWGFVNISKDHNPKYFALYVGKPYSSVLYFAEIESVTQPLKSKEEINKIQKEDLRTFETGKRVIHMKPGSLVTLKDPVPLKNKRQAPRALRYSTLQKLINATYVEDL